MNLETYTFAELRRRFPHFDPRHVMWAPGLPFRLDIFEGPWIAGGSLVRALLGQFPTEFDIVFASRAQLDATALALLRDGAALVERAPSLDANEARRPPDAGMVLAWNGFELDLCGGSHGALVSFLRAHDIIASRLATDGRVILADPAALADLADRRLRVSRITRPERLQKYINDFGLYPRQGADVDYDLLRLMQDGLPVPGWSATGLTWRQAVLGEAP